MTLSSSLVRTQAFQACSTGSNPVRVTNFYCSAELAGGARTGSSDARIRFGRSPDRALGERRENPVGVTFFTAKFRVKFQFALPSRYLNYELSETEGLHNG